MGEFRARLRDYSINYIFVIPGYLNVARITAGVASSLIMICVMVCGCTVSPANQQNTTQTPGLSGFIYPTPTGVDYPGLSAGQQRLVDAALNNTTIKAELGGREYVVTSAVITNGSSFWPWDENGTVSIDILYPDGSIDYHMVVSVDFQNNSVPFINREKPLPRSAMQ